MVAAELAKMTRADAGQLGGKAGEATPNPGLLPTPVAPVSVQQAADMLNVGRGTVEAAKKVIRDGVPVLADAVKSGEVSVSAAAEIAKAPAEVQAAIVALPADERVEVLKAKRAEAKAIRAAPPTKSEAKRIAVELQSSACSKTMHGTSASHIHASVSDCSGCHGKSAGTASAMDLAIVSVRASSPDRNATIRGTELRNVGLGN